jgi:tRNA A-37 threonylcarbamoyl transferase component Bud32
MAHTPPTIVAGKYEVLGRLGEGGQGSVWKVRHVELDQIRAMKWQPDEGLDDSASRFRREGLALARLRHPHIVEVFDFGRDADAHYLVMEYVEGQNLAQRLKTRGRPTVPDALEMARQVASALAYAHRQPYVDSQGRRHEGMIHRDIKPSNILLREQAAVHVLLADFGLVKLGDAGERTTTGAVMGTYKYSAPEQLGLRRGRERVGVDHRADVFAFGLVLYELLEGRQFHEGLDMGEVLGRVLYEELDADFAQPVSAKLRALVTSCIRRFPEERPETMDAVLRELELSMADFRGEETQTRFVPHADQDIDQQIEVLLRERERRRVQVAQATARTARQEAVAADAEALAADPFGQAAAADEEASAAARDGRLDDARRVYERAAELFGTARAAATTARQRREIDGLVREVDAARAHAEAEGVPELSPDAWGRAIKLDAAARAALARNELDGVARDLRAAHDELVHAARDAIAVRTRREAKAARQRLETVRRAAEAAQAPELAGRAFALAADVEAQGEAALGNGDVLSARDLYERAAADFEAATVDAVRERDRRAVVAAGQATERARTAAREAGAAELAPEELRRAEALAAEADGALARVDLGAAADLQARAADAFGRAAGVARERALERAREAAARTRADAEAARAAARAGGVVETALRDGDAAVAAGDARGAQGDFAAADADYARARGLFAEALARARRERADGARRQAERARDAAAAAHAARVVTAVWDDAEAERARAGEALAGERLEDAAAAFARAAASYERAATDAAAARERAAGAREGAVAARTRVADQVRGWAEDALAGADALVHGGDERLAAHDLGAACARYAEAAAAFEAAGRAAAAARSDAARRAQREAEAARAAAEASRRRADDAGASREAADLVRQAAARLAAGNRAIDAGDLAAATAAFTDATAAYDRAASDAQAAVAARERAAAERLAQARRAAEQAREAAETARQQAAATSAERDAAAELATAAERFASGRAALDGGDYAAATSDFTEARTAWGEAAAVAQAAATARARAEAEERTRAKRMAEQARAAATAARDGTAGMGAEGDAPGEMRRAVAAFRTATAAFEAGDYVVAARDFAQAAIAWDEAATVVQAAVEARARAEAEARAGEEAAQAAAAQATRDRAERAAHDAQALAQSARRAAEATTAAEDAADELRRATARFDAASAALSAGDHATAAAAFGDAAASFEAAIGAARAAVEARAEAAAREARERAAAEARARERAEAEARAREAEERARRRQAAEQARARTEAAARAAAEAKEREARAQAAEEAKRREAAARAAAEAKARDAAAREAAAAKAREAEAQADVTQLPRAPDVDRTRIDVGGTADERTRIDVRPTSPPARVTGEVPAPVARPGRSPAVLAGGATALVAIGIVAWIVTRPGRVSPPALEWASLTPADATVAAREGTPLAFAAAVRGAEGSEDVRYAWTLDGTRRGDGATWTFTPDFAGAAREHDVRVSASRDGRQLERAWRVAVENVDRPPRIEAPADETTTIEVTAGAPLELAVRASDPDLADGDALTYAWRRDGAPVASAADASLTLSDARDGERIRVAVLDEAGLEAWREWTVVVRAKPVEIEPVAPTTLPAPPEAAPTIVELTPAPGRFELAGGTSRTFRVRATDPNPGDTVRYAWLVDGRKVASDASFVLEAPADPREGQRMTVELQVADATGKQVTREWTVTLTVPRPRVTSADPRGPELTLVPGQSRSFVVRAASERAGARLRFEWTLDDRPLPIAGDALELPTDLAPGRHTVAVVAVDEQDLRSEPRRWSVVVKPETARVPDDVVSPAPGGTVTNAEVQRWLGQYRAAFETNDRGALVALGIAANASEAERMVKGWGPREVAISGATIELKGATARVVFRRVDKDKENERELPYPAPLAYELRKDGGGLRAVR